MDKGYNQFVSVKEGADRGHAEDYVESWETVEGQRHQ